MPTLTDVAHRAGVSRVTASRVLNGTYLNKVSPETRVRVMQAVADLNYRSSIPARALRSKRTMEFGLLIPDLAFSFMPDVVQGLQDIATEMDYGCLVYLSHEQPHQEEKVLHQLQSRRVDGIIWMPTPHPTENTLCLVNSLPTVQLLFRMPGTNSPAVLIDQEQGGFVAADHLLELGHRRIAYIFVGHRHWHPREVGYRRALNRYKVPFDPSLLIQVSVDAWDESVMAAKKLLTASNRPTAILAASDTVALAVLRAAHEVKLAIPRDLSLVGFGNVNFSPQVEVPLTTIDHPKRLVGQLAMQKLGALLASKDEEDTILPVSLVERNSTAPPPIPQ